MGIPLNRSFPQAGLPEPCIIIHNNNTIVLPYLPYANAHPTALPPFCEMIAHVRETSPASSRKICNTLDSMFPPRGNFSPAAKNWFNPAGTFRPRRKTGSAQREVFARGEKLLQPNGKFSPAAKTCFNPTGTFRPRRKLASTQRTLFAHGEKSAQPNGNFSPAA
jgi:hypothetical protein